MNRFGPVGWIGFACALAMATACGDDGGSNTVADADTGGLADYDGNPYLYYGLRAMD